jgi:SPP1 gp7 family putative phage head morphogenesis protein
MKSDRLATQIADMIIADTAGAAICEEIRAAWAARVSNAIEKEGWPHADVFARLYKRLDPWDKKFAAMLRAIWDKERRIVLANLKKMRKWAHTDKLGLADIARILYASGAFKDMLTDSTYDLFIQEMKEEGQNHLDDLDLHAAFDVDNPRIQKWLEEYCPKLSKNLEEVNIDDLKRVLREGIGEGEGIPDLAKRVNELFESYDRVRAEMIARTETIRASNQSALEAYRQSGVVKQKTWLVAEDERTCDICIGYGNQDPIGLDESYGTTDYETIYVPPAHPSCRCAVTSYFEET